MKRHILLLLLLALTWGAPTAQATAVIRMLPCIFTPGQSTTVDFEMLNDEEITGVELDLYLPEGFTVDTYTLKNKTFFSLTADEDRAPWHTIDGNYKKDDDGNQYFKVLIYSFDLDLFDGTEGKLFSIDITADETVSLPGGVQSFTLKKVKCARDNGTSYNEMVVDCPFRLTGTEPVDLTIPDGGYATLCLPYAAEVPEGVKAYRATSYADGYINLVQQTTIEACTPLIMKGTAGTYHFSGDNSAATEMQYAADLLTGTLIPSSVSEGYVLQQQDAGFGFYEIQSTKTLPTYRCVLTPPATVPSASYLPFRLIDSDETTDIQHPTHSAAGTATYNLAGLRVKNNSRGILVRDGKKIIR